MFPLNVNLTFILKQNQFCLVLATFISPALSHHFRNNLIVISTIKWKYFINILPCINLKLLLMSNICVSHFAEGAILDR